MFHRIGFASCTDEATSQNNPSMPVLPPEVSPGNLLCASTLRPET